MVIRVSFEIIEDEFAAMFAVFAEIAALLDVMLEEFAEIAALLVVMFEVLEDTPAVFAEILVILVSIRASLSSTAVLTAVKLSFTCDAYAGSPPSNS